MSGEIDMHPRPTEAPAPDVTPDPAAAVKPRRKLGDMIRDLMRTRLDKSGSRIRLVGLAFAALFLVIGGKLFYFGFKPDPQSLRRAASEAVSHARPDIVDRNGEILATDIKVTS